MNGTTEVRILRPCLSTYMGLVGIPSVGLLAGVILINMKNGEGVWAIIAVFLLWILLALWFLRTEKVELTPDSIVVHRWPGRRRCISRGSQLTFAFGEQPPFPLLIYSDAPGDGRKKPVSVSQKLYSLEDLTALLSALARRCTCRPMLLDVTLAYDDSAGTDVLQVSYLNLHTDEYSLVLKTQSGVETYPVGQHAEVADKNGMIAVSSLPVERRKSEEIREAPPRAELQLGTLKSNTVIVEV